MLKFGWMKLGGIMADSVLLDTSFLIRLLNPNEKLHLLAKSWYRYFLQKEMIMKTSTIWLAEYCVQGQLSDIPFRNIQVISFNFNHAEVAGAFGKYIFIEKKNDPVLLKPRPIILNDAKIFAQAEVEPRVGYFVTADKRCEIMYDYIRKYQIPNFELIDIHQSVQEFLGELPFSTEEE